jgi:hypothetical protein
MYYLKENIMIFKISYISNVVTREFKTIHTDNLGKSLDGIKHKSSMVISESELNNAKI